MRFGVLGPLQVVTDDPDTARGIAAPRLRAVLAVLLWRANQPVPVDELADLVWDGRPPGGAREAVRALVMRLRRQLPPLAADRIVTRAPGYAVEVSGDELDASRAAMLVREADAAVRGGRWPDVSRAATDALSLWRGTPLIDVPSDLLRDRWIPVLEQLHLRATTTRIEAGLHQGRHEQLISELRELTARQPLHESFHRQLMLALARSGRRAEALDAYEMARRTLATELGIDPGPELRRLQERVLAGDAEGAAAPPTGDAEGAAPPIGDAEGAAPPIGDAEGAAAPLATLRQLPLAGRHFTGRSTELRELDELLGTGRAATVVVIDGPAGVGKTSLAVRWAHRVAGEFPHVQLYVNLRGFDPGGCVTTAEEAVHGFLEALGVPPGRIPSTLDAQAALYRSLVAGKRVLVLLDNARDAAQVRPLLPGTPDALIVVTSRNRLTPLVVADGAHTLSLGLLSAVDARELLSERLGAERVAAEPEAVNRIVRACAGLPLALAIVAGRAQHVPLACLAAQLGAVPDRLDTLDGGDPASRIRSVFSWSYAALTRPAARLFRLLGLPGAGDISAAAVASLAGAPVREVRAMLAELTSANLLSEPQPGRYSGHDLLRAYAVELALREEAEPERDAALTRLLDHYVRSAYRADRLLDPHRDPMYPQPGTAAPGAQPESLADRAAAVEWLTAERPAMLAALHQAAGQAGPTASPERVERFAGYAWRLAWCLDTALRWQGYRHQRTAAWQSALKATRRLPDPVVRAHVHRFLAGSLRAVGLPDQAEANLRLAIALYDRAGDQLGRAHSHFLLAGARLQQGDPQQALDHARQALALYQAAGNPRGEGLARNGIGWYSAELGDYGHTIVQCTQALALLEAVGDTAGQAAAWDTLGYAHHHLADHDRAAACYRRSIDLYRQIGDRYYHADALTHLGDTHLAAENHAAARAAWQQALRILADLGHPDAAQVQSRLRELRDSAPV